MGSDTLRPQARWWAASWQPHRCKHRPERRCDSATFNAAPNHGQHWANGDAPIRQMMCSGNHSHPLNRLHPILRQLPVNTGWHRWPWHRYRELEIRKTRSPGLESEPDRWRSNQTRSFLVDKPLVLPVPRSRQRGSFSLL